MQDEKAETNEELRVNKKKGLLYAADDRPPRGMTCLLSLQHMLLVISVGISVPVTLARAAGLDIQHSAAFLAASIFAMGVCTVLSTVPGRYIGSGRQCMSACESAALACSVLAVEKGGIPLVLGMVAFSGVVRFVLSHFAFRLRKLFPPEVTGTMIMILGINLIPTSFRFFLGSNAAVHDPMHIIVAGATLVFMIVCALFIKPLRPYTALVGIVFGYILSIAVGIFDPSTLTTAVNGPVFSLPVYPELSYSFDPVMIMPFAIFAFVSLIDNIADLSSIQTLNQPGLKKVDWKRIGRGIRGSSVGTVATAFLGGTAQGTATANIGVAGATGVTSRIVAYVAAGMLIVLSFFPGITGIISVVPEPVLGAVLIYSLSYIMAGGFSTLRTRELDNRRIFAVFISIAAAISTMIPGLYSFVPKEISDIFVTPMVMGVIVLITLTLIGRIGTRKRFAFVSGVDDVAIEGLNGKIAEVCAQWGAEHSLMRNLQITLDGLCEALYEANPEVNVHFDIRYDQMQIRLHVETESLAKTIEDEDSKNGDPLNISLKMIRNVFDNVRIKNADGKLAIDMDADL